MVKKCYYEILSVSRTASDVELKKSYRKFAMKFHPDRNPGDKDAEDKFKELSEAYEILSDPQKRSAYDQFGHDGLAGNASGGGGFSNFSDIFSEMFGGGSRGPQPGNDLQYELSISLEEAIHGTTVDIRVPTNEICNSCKGTGAESGSAVDVCPTCRGQGQVRIQQGFFAVSQTCPSCHGRGKIIKKSCKSCHGEGNVRKNKTLSVKIPSGVDNGDNIRLRGEGEAGETGSPHGDLYVLVRVKQHNIFEREGNTLYCSLPISFVKVTLGGNIEVPTLGGKVDLKIPAGTQSGQKFKIANKGVKSVRARHVGDLIVQLNVETPVKLTKEQKKLLEDLDDSMQKKWSKHSPKADTFLDSVKSFFKGTVDKTAKTAKNKSEPWE